MQRSGSDQSTGWRAAYVRHYFAAITLFVLTISIVAFWDNIVTDTGQKSNSDPKMIVHGLFTGAWVAILFVQSALIDARNARLHRRLGWWGAAIAAGLVLSTIYLFAAVWKGWPQMDPDVRANRLLLPGFAVFAGLAIVWRKRPVLHKRAMLGGTLLLLSPILSRAYDPLVVPVLELLLGPPPAESTELPFDDPYLPIFFTVWILLFATMWLYDRLTVGRVQRVTLAVFGWFIAGWTLAFIT